MRHKLFIYISGAALLILLNTKCANSDNSMIDTIGIVTSINFKTDIFIFFNQDTSLGSVKLENQEHLFYAYKNPSIFFTKEQLGEGVLKTYIMNGGVIKEISYESEMTIHNAPNEAYQVIGGSYRGLTTHLYKDGKQVLRFITFIAGEASDVRNHFLIPDSVVIANYELGLEEARTPPAPASLPGPTIK